MLTRLLAAALLVVVAACGSPATSDDPGDGSFRGAVLGRPVPRPDVTLTGTDGMPFDVVERTRGRVTVVAPIFTHCDDICPTQMADLAAALRRLPPEVAGAVDVLALTTDPARDTPERLRTWLDRFDPGFEGLTGSPEELSAAYRALGLPDASPATPGPDGGYQVDHVVQVFAFGQDDVARVGFARGALPGDYAHDLALLVEGVRPPEVGNEERDEAARLTGGTASVGGVTAFGAFVDGADGVVRLSLTTSAPTADRLVGASLADGSPVRLVSPSGEPLAWDATSGPVVSPSELLRLGPDGAARLVVDPREVDADGVFLVLQLQQSGALTLEVPREPGL